VGEGLELRAGELGKDAKKRLDDERSGVGRSRDAALPLVLLLSPPPPLADLRRLRPAVTGCDDGGAWGAASEMALTATSSSGALGGLRGGGK